MGCSDHSWRTVKDDGRCLQLPIFHLLFLNHTLLVLFVFALLFPARQDEGINVGVAHLSHRHIRQ